MSKAVFRPFDRYRFDEGICFLTGEQAVSHPSVFPDWLLERYQLADKPLKMLDEQILTYEDIKVPVSEKTLSALQMLDKEVSEAFLSGYQSVKEMSQLILFQWIAKQVYGIIHWEIRAGIRQQLSAGESFNFSQSIAHKFGNLQLMLQSLTRPVEFEGVLPWSIKVFKIDDKSDSFSYKDEMNTLAFSFRMRDFGIIACLQDNGECLNYHREILDKIGDDVLHPIQFEELSARFFYSAYLFNRLPEYTVLEVDEAVYIDSMPLRISSRPVYDLWQAKTYAQVLENFWKPWVYSFFEIMKNPQQPLSFLLDEYGEFISAKRVTQQLQAQAK